MDAAVANKTTSQNIEIATPSAFPANEKERLEALLQYEVLDSSPERAFDDLALLAANICQVPIALVTLVDKDRQWFKANVGLPVTETTRDVSFCAHAILQSDLFMVQDATKDQRFATNPLVTGDPQIRFYAGMPLYTGNGQHALGTMCVIDRVPRELSKGQQESLQALARQAQALFELRLLLLRERQLSRIDSLTGAANRRSFYENLQKEISRLQRHKRPFSIAYIDLDNLKQVNDRFGHEQGDAILATVCATVRRNLRQTDTIARLGGDEFAILLAESHREGAQAAIATLRQKLLAAMSEKQWPVTFSIGVVTCTEAPQSVEEIIKKADDLMYLVKSAGKNGILHATFPEP